MSETRPIRIGTRGSKLALWQANHVADTLREATGREVELEIIKTTGDKILDVPLAKIGDKGLFTKEIEVALEAGEVDLAVHSMKDMPTALPGNLKIGAALVREKPNDAILMRKGVEAPSDGRELLLSLPAGARIGTSSLRRRSQIRYLRNDLDIQDIRGNLDTRLKKLDDGEFDATLLAGAGVRRLGWGDRITAEIPTDTMLPAVGQGAICIEIRDNDPHADSLCEILDHTETHLAVRAERGLMRTLEGGCQVPIGGLATIDGSTINMRGILASLDGTILLTTEGQGSIDAPESLGESLAADLIRQGGQSILEEIRAAQP